MKCCMEINIKGIVQGVGFRPFVYNLAKNHNLLGYVLNNTSGVSIEIEGDRSDLDIRKSDDTEEKFVPISPEIATCQDCISELFDTEDRRYRFPFINCSNC